jgi:hypothetical protein
LGAVLVFWFNEKGVIWTAAAVSRLVGGYAAGYGTVFSLIGRGA